MEKYIFIGVMFIAFLILCVQIFTEIIKSTFSIKPKFYNLVVLSIALVLTILGVIAICKFVIKITITAYIIAGAIVLSFFIAYGAMVGYDKLFSKIFDTAKSGIEWYNKIKK